MVWTCGVSERNPDKYHLNGITYQLIVYMLVVVSICSRTK